ncbi:MAG: hypothetical protein U0360_04050 [Dehalococcoidia bacterium]
MTASPWMQARGAGMFNRDLHVAGGQPRPSSNTLALAHRGDLVAEHLL